MKNIIVLSSLFRSEGLADVCRPAGRGTTVPSTSQRGQSSTRSTTCSPPQTRNSTESGVSSVFKWCCQQWCQLCCQPSLLYTIFICNSTVEMCTSVRLKIVRCVVEDLQFYALFTLVGQPSLLPRQFHTKNSPLLLIRGFVKIQWCTHILWRRFLSYSGG